MTPVRKKTADSLRSGYTTGACAAAAAKAAAQLLSGARLKPGDEVDIPLPGRKRASFRLFGCELSLEAGQACASVIKDAGDDPDVTNGAEIAASAAFAKGKTFSVLIKGGKGVGLVTRPGLPVAVGEPAINPVPRRMITQAVREVMGPLSLSRPIEVTISVPQGEELARKTLNARLGIVGGISILGTTGIVKPLSGAAWRAAISASMKVARAMGIETVVLSAGRTSERAHMRKFKFFLPPPSYIMMGDYVEFSLKEAARQRFGRIHICAQWAKLIKIAMGTPDTHVRSGAMDVSRAADFLRHECGIPLPERPYNTAREIFRYILQTGPQAGPGEGAKKVCAAAAAYGHQVSGLPVTAFLVSYEGKIFLSSDE